MIFGRLVKPSLLSRTLCTIKKPRILKMLTKEECMLCDQALEEIEENLPKELLKDILVEKVDITDDGNEALYDRWRFEIPVFYFEDKYLCKNRIDIPKLIEKLEKYK